MPITITKKKSVALTTVEISFFWKMKQLVIIDPTVTDAHRVKHTYVLRTSDDTSNKVALWVSGTGGARVLNVGYSNGVPTGHTKKEFDFTDDACGIWLDKTTTAEAAEGVVIGIGDIRNIPGNPAGGVVKAYLDVPESSAVIVTCPDDFQLTFHAASYSSLLSVLPATVVTP